MDDFKTYYGLGNLNIDDLEFEKACRSDAVKSVLGALGQDWASNSITTAPFGAILRVAEGIDSLQNLATSGADLPTEVERGAVILCGLSQLGGLIFSILAIIVGMALCICAPVGSALALYLFRLLNQTEEASTARNLRIDKLLKERRVLMESEEKGVDKQTVRLESEPFLSASGV